VLALWAPWRAAPVPTRLAFELPLRNVAGPSVFSSLAISSDGSQLVARFGDGAESGLMVRPLAHVESVMLANTVAATYPFWSPDGQYVLYQEDDPQTKTDLWMLPLAGDRKPARLLATPFNESEAALSPDGCWMAYTSDESGERQVYVQAFPTWDRKRQVSTGRIGATPRWSADGKELFFDAGSVMSAVSVSSPGPPGELRLGQPQPLFRGLLAEPPHHFDIASDGRRFLVLLTPRVVAGTQGAATEVPVSVVVNWKSRLVLAR